MELKELIAESGSKKLYKDGDTCVKLFSADYKKSDILNEALNQARVEETGLHVPAVRDVMHLDDGRWAIVMDYIEGESLENLMKAHPEKEDEYLELFVNLQLEIQGKQNVKLNKLRDKMNDKINMSGLDATTRYELHSRLDSMPKHNKLCHGDFNPSNVLIDKKGKAHVIDWAHVTQGNASADVARTYLLFCLQKKKDLGDKYLKLFCQKTDTAIQYVQQWLPIVASSQLVKGKKEERDFLLKWVNVCEYE